MPVLRLDPDLPMPGYAHPGDAGLDLYARVDVTLEPGERAAVPCGIALALPVGYVGLVTPRSGLAARYGLGMVNSRASSTPVIGASSRCCSSTMIEPMRSRCAEASGSHSCSCWCIRRCT